MKPYAFGVDIGGTTVKIGLFKTDGTIIHKWEIPTITEGNGEQILKDVVNAIEDELATQNISKDELEGVGIGVPGAVLKESIVNRCVNLGWGVVPVADELKAALGIDNIKVGNDANVAALGELWKGGGKGCDTIVMVTLGTGVGGGIVVNGKIVEGAFGAAGELGHFHVNDNEVMSCNCGNKGCLEQYASATGIIRLAKGGLMQMPESSLSKYSDFMAKEVFDEAKAGDPLSNGIVQTIAEMLGKALATISAVVDPEAFVIGGGVSRAGSILIDPIQQYFQKHAFHASKNARFVAAELGNDAGIYGAVKMIL